jgi:Acetoacetate decarboxylase (ADC)
MASSASPSPVYDIDGRRVGLPCVVRDASAGTAMFDVDALAARRFLPGDDFAIVESSPGRCQLVLAVIDYRDNDLGDYLEVGVTLFVTPRGGEGEAGTFIVRLPVDQAFTCAAGRAIWGFPKSVEDIALDYAPGSVTATLRMDRELVLRLTLPRGGDDTMPPLPMTTYTLIDGRPHATAFAQGGTGAQVRAGGDGVTLELGVHPLAKELAGLGLPAPALMSTWTEHMAGTFEAPQALTPG